jgi:hypothetical protein
MATVTAAGGGGNWTTGASWVGGVVPTAVDDVQLTGSSGNVTINAAAFCRSLDCTGYTGTLTHAAAVTLAIGDSTAGAGNVALKLAAGMTYTLGASTATLTFVSTSATQQTITSAGKTMGTWLIDGVGSSYLLADNNTSVGLVTANAGTFNTGGVTCNWLAFDYGNSAARTISLGASAISVSRAIQGWTAINILNLTISPNTATVTHTAAGVITSAYGLLNWNGLSVVFNSTVQGLSGTNNGGIFNNLTINGGTIKNTTYLFNGSLTCTGTLTITGDSSINRILIASSTTGTARPIQAASVTITNADFMDIAAGGAANWNLSAITGGSGDCGGNVGITFTTAATQTWQGTAGGNWSDISKWTSRTPLPQDNVIINAGFVASQTVVSDMPRLGKSIDFTGAGAVNWSNSSVFGSSMYGSLTLTSNVTVSLGGGHALAGRGAYTLTSAGKTFTPNITIVAPTGSYTFQDAFNSVNTLSVTAGALNTNSQTITCGSLQCLGPLAVANLSSSTVNTTTLSSYAFLATNGAILSAAAATINITTVSSSQRIVAVLYNVPTLTVNYTLTGSTGPLLLTTYGGRIGTLNFYDTANARTLLLEAGQVAYIQTTFNVRGSAGKPVSIISNAAGTTATISKSSGAVDCDYLSIQDSAATGGASWYAGSNSTNISNNSGWFFQPYSPSKFLELM